MPTGKKVRYIVAAGIFLFGMTTIGTESVKWIMLTGLLYSVPLIGQFIPIGWVQMISLWWGIFLLLQTLVSPWVPGLRYVTLPPNYERVFNVRGGVPGVSGLQRVTTDPLGYRVSQPIDYADSEPYRIFAIGGSTTEQIMLDDRKTWTSQLETALNSAETGYTVEVINTGVSGLRAGNHLATLEKVLPLNPDMAIFMLGANDWNHQIRRDNAGLFQRLISNHTEAFWLSNTALGKILRNYKLNATGTKPAASGEAAEVIDEFGEYYADQAGSLARADQRDYRPDTVDRDYSHKLQQISELCHANQLTCVFITQANGYSPAADPEYTSRFWMTPPNESYTLSLDDMAHIASLYNNYLRDFATQNNHPVCDIAARIQSVAANFFDDCHFSEAGAARVADETAACLVGHVLNGESDPATIGKAMRNTAR